MLKFGILILLLINSNHSLRIYSKNDIIGFREEVREMFHHAYDSYLKYAYPYDELRPLSCDGIDTWGSYSLTLIDALDTLAVMGNHTEFQRVVDIIVTKANFDANINVSVFETNIRIIGGLLSAHLLSHRAGVSLEPGWPCNGPLLRLAESVAKRLITAFDNRSGMPYGTVNLRHGVPSGETTVTCTAGVGTFIVEFGALSRLTGDPLYEEVAMNALYALYNHRSSIGLVGNHIDIATGRWTAQDAGIGAGVDSYYEYLVKGAILLQRPELMQMFHDARAAIDKYMKRDDWHLWVSMSKGQVTLPVFQSLEAYWPGVLSLIGETSKAMRSIHNYHQVWKQYGFTPEFFNIPQGEAGTNRESYPLRPELIESVMYLYRATRDPYLLEVGVDILRSIQHSSRTPCGYATIKDVRDHRKEDRMESFFLAETTKYLYLLFDPDNFIHNSGEQGTLIDTPTGECIIDAGGYIFNTEAHPIDPGALHCCYDLPKEKLYDLNELKKNMKLFKGESIKSLRRNEVPDAEPEFKVTLNHIFAEKSETKTADGENKVADEKEGTVEKVSNVDGTVEIVRLSKHEMDDDKLISENSGTSEVIDLTKERPFSDDTKYSESFQDGQTNDSENNNKSEDNNNKIEGNANQNSSKFKIVPEFVNQFLNLNNTKKKFDPQKMLERIRFENKYPKNSTWENNYGLLLCQAQPYLQRLSIMGEFFDNTV